MKELKILKGTIVWAPMLGELKAVENGFLVAMGNEIIGVFEKLPAEYAGHKISDYGNHLIIPGFVDIHAHAPQFPNRGIGYDMELLKWLTTYTFPEEAKYIDSAYAQNIYKKVVNEFIKHGTTRCVFFGTIFRESTELLMKIIAESGLSAYVGKVNMDRNSPDYYIEETKQSIEETKKFIESTKDLYPHVKPIITPRFVPTCTPEIMAELGKLAKEYQLPVQSHLSENLDEVAWVQSLHPDIFDYGSVYNKYGLFGQTPTIMAHCIYLTENEIEMITEKNIYVAHCPDSNSNIISGISPIRKLLNAKAKVGIGSDISGGHNISMLKNIVSTAQTSKLRYVYLDKKEVPYLSIPELFFLATKGGGEFFGKVGSFEKGYEFDCLIIDDSQLDCYNAESRSPKERLERYIYLGDDREIIIRIICGKEINAR